MNRASWQSQLKGEPCGVEDTAEMFVLRESDDYQSRIGLGNALSAQYRFREAADAYRSALIIRQDDPMTWLRLGGAALTVFDFGAAHDAFTQFLASGGSEQAIAFHMGFWHYLQRDYPAAAAWFAKCLPCGDETKAAAVYWHTLACVRAGRSPTLLSECSKDMRVGHHGAYLAAVCVFRLEADAEVITDRALAQPDDLNCSIALYGVSVFREQQGRPELAKQTRQQLLPRDGAWPCLAYLAALRDEKLN